MITKIKIYLRFEYTVCSELRLKSTFPGQIIHSFLTVNDYEAPSYGLIFYFRTITGIKAPMICQAELISDCLFTIESHSLLSFS